MLRIPIQTMRPFRKKLLPRRKRSSRVLHDWACSPSTALHLSFLDTAFYVNDTGHYCLFLPWTRKPCSNIVLRNARASKPGNSSPLSPSRQWRKDKNQVGLSLKFSPLQWKWNGVIPEYWNLFEFAVWNWKWNVRHREDTYDKKMFSEKLFKYSTKLHRFD